MASFLNARDVTCDRVPYEFGLGCEVSVQGELGDLVTFQNKIKK